MAMPEALQNSLARYNQGPVSVVVDPAGTSEVELFVEGGVDIEFIRGQEAVEMDAVGQYDIRSTGDGATFELNLPEESVDVLNVLFPDGLDGSASATTYRGFGRAAGRSARSNALAFRFRPWQTRTSDTEQVELWLCVPDGNLTKSMKKDGKYQYTQTFRALPDVTKADGDLIGRVYAPSR